jgi:hypothetical protein
MRHVDTRISAKWLKVGIGPLALCWVLVTYSLPVLAQGGIETAIKPFALLDVQANFAVRYMLDEQDRSSAATPRSFEDRVTWEQELFIRTWSYVYHPGFLNIDFGIGPKLVQQTFDSDVGSNRNNETFLNLLARLNFLQLKTYPFSLHFQTDTPSVSTGLAGRYLSERERYGIDSQLYQSERTRVWWSLGHEDIFGGGFGNILDEDIDRGEFNVQTAYGERNLVTFRQRRELRKSKSGSVGLPIQASTNRNDITELRLENYFGSAGRHSLMQNYRRLDQELDQLSTTSTDNQNYNIRMNLAHSERLSSRTGYDFASTERDGADFSAHRIRASITDTVNEQFDYRFETFFDTEDQPNFERDTLGGSANFSLSKPIKGGSIGVGFRAGLGRTDQVATSDTVQVFDEPLVLVGTNPVALAQEFVVAGSVIVRNETSTQVFVENVDYRLVVVGSVTSVQRLVGGNIEDGQRVLVDYEYRTSGTAEFDTLTTSLGVNLNLLRYFSAGADFQLKDTTLREGAFTTPTNDFDSFRLNFSADFPVGDRWQFGVLASYWDRNEEIAPSVSNSLSVQASTYLWGSTRLRMSAAHNTVDQENSIEDVDQMQYRVGLSSRLWARVLLTYDVTYLEDDGGSLPRQQTQHRLDIQWNYRAVRFYLRATRSDESLGATERDFTRVTAEVSRFFR